MAVGREQKTEDRRQNVVGLWQKDRRQLKTNIREQIAERLREKQKVRRQKKAGGKRQKTNGRKQKAEGIRY